jgi:hypothetical protein
MKNTKLVTWTSFAILAVLLVAGFQNCGKSMKFSAPSQLVSNDGDITTGGDPGNDDPPNNNPPPPPDPGSTVCEGIGGDQGTGDRHFGISAHIFTGDSSIKSAVTYANPANAVMSADGTQPVNLFFNNVNVPNRSFTSGFINQNGDALTDSHGNMLIEYFGLKFESQIRLADTEEPGFYEFGVEGDDGAVLKLKDNNGVFQTVISNDGDHPARTGCSDANNVYNVFYFDHNTVVPFELYYYQGPRVYIALRLFWRKVDGPGANLSQGCDSTALGNLDGTAASSFWKIMSPENFLLPGNQSNPCVQ